MENDKETEGRGEGSGTNISPFERGGHGASGVTTLPHKGTENQGTKPVSPFHSVNRPSHYTASEIECIDAIRAQLSPEEWRGFLRGQIAKYNWRMTKKGAESEDAKKLAFYATFLTGTDPRR